MCVNYAFDPPPRMIHIRLTVRIYNFGSIQCLKLRAIEFSGSLAKTLFYCYSGAIRRYSALMSIATATSGCYSGAILAL